MIDFPANPTEGQGFTAAGKQYTYSGGVWSGGGVPVVGGYAVGDLVLTAGNTAPQGTLKANGAIVSRTVYADLFARIGTTYGAGDGSTTFALPDWRGEFFRGWDDGRGVNNGRQLNTFEAATSLRTTALIWNGGDLESGEQIFGTSISAPDLMQNYPGGFPAGAVAPGGATLSGAVVDNYMTALPTNNPAGITNGLNVWAHVRPRNVALLACIAYRNGAGGGVSTVVVPGQNMTMPYGNLRVATDLNNEHNASYLLFNAATLNAPAAVGGHVEVIPAINDEAKPTAGGDWTTQRAVSNENPPREWFRRYDGGAGAWSAWAAVVNAGSDGTYPRGGVPGVTNLNNATVPGFYSYGDTSTNTPNPGGWGALQVIATVNDSAGLTNGKWVTQLAYTTANPPQCYVRNNINNSSWSPWVRLPDASSAQTISGNWTYNGAITLNNWIVSQTNNVTNSFVASGDKGGAYSDWTAALCPALQMDCPRSDSAYMIWRATRWGGRHLAACHVFEGGTGSSLPTISFALDGNANVHVFHRNGNIYTTAYGYLHDYFQPRSSDTRDKRQLEPTTVDGLDVVRRIPLYSFRWREGGPQNPEPLHECAPIAQYLQAEMPSLVEQVKNGAGEDRLAVNLLDLLGVTMRAVQQLAEQVDELRAKLDAIAP